MAAKVSNSLMPVGTADTELTSLAYLKLSEFMEVVSVYAPLASALPYLRYFIMS